MQCVLCITLFPWKSLPLSVCIGCNSIFHVIQSILYSCTANFDPCWIPIGVRLVPPGRSEDVVLGCIRILHILFLCSVYYLTVNVVRSTAMRRTPPNASEHHRSATGHLEITYFPSVRCTSDAGKIKVTCDN